MAFILRRFLQRLDLEYIRFLDLQFSARVDLTGGKQGFIKDLQIDTTSLSY
jgi:hypothetical protein